MSNCRSQAVAPACFTNAAGAQSSIYQHTVYNPSGAVFATYYLDSAGAVVDTSVGTVTAGACSVASPDVEWVELCDVATDGTVTPFIRRSVTSFAADGSVIDPVQVDDFETDKVTAYTVGGVVGDCATCPDEAPLGLITDLTLLD